MPKDVIIVLIVVVLLFASLTSWLIANDLRESTCTVVAMKKGTSSVYFTYHGCFIYNEEISAYIEYKL